MSVYLIIHNFKLPAHIQELNAIISKIFNSCYQLTQNSLLITSDKNIEQVYNLIFYHPFFIDYTQKHSFDPLDLEIFIDNKEPKYEDNLLFITPITD